MKGISVHDAAHQLGVSPQRVRAMIQQGVLAASKVGRSWVLDPADTDSRRRTSESGRPLSARTAWAVLALLSGDLPDWVHPSARSRLRARLCDRNWLRRSLIRSQPRATLHKWRVHPADLRKLPLSLPLVQSGLSAKRAGLDVVPGDDRIDAYVDHPSLPTIEARFRPLRESSNPNLILRVPTQNWILHFTEAPPAVVAADLLSSDDPRVARAAERVLEALAR